ncbi:hypothetical protein [Streptomyces salinarius]|uniref:hypothetical protein n=1 Tax=Streptomyces salinarius TaxID=2762598 RepID=UPI001649783C|nr:hypothetical protein [Streptomyces salinarius]
MEEALEVVLPDGVRTVYAAPPAGSEGLLYRPDLASDDPMSLAAALNALATSAQTVPRNIIPIAPVDDRSFAVAVCRKPGIATVQGEGAVLRWHLDDIPRDRQGALLDITAPAYLRTRTQEQAARGRGLAGMAKAQAAYAERYGQPGSRPPGFALRPVQLACQNVVVGLAAFRHDSTFDGLSVPLWQTCDVPHVATHEGTRALSLLMLCDAFACGGTMEIRFRGHPEQSVPAALLRFARTKGIALGQERRDLITPEEARRLFWAVTDMPAGLAARAAELTDGGLVAPERLCYMLAAGVWRDIELDFMLATSGRAASVLAGGALPEERRARAAESEVCRAAVLTGTLHRRLDSVDSAGRTGQARVFEDGRRGVTWVVDGRNAAVEFTGVDAPLPWLPDPGDLTQAADRPLLVLPRARPTAEDESLGVDLARRSGARVALVVPDDAPGLDGCRLPVLRCPYTLYELDTSIEGKLLSARVSRA